MGDDAATTAAESFAAGKIIMEQALDYTTGWIDISIHDFLCEIDEPPSNMAYALITCLDSSFEVESIVRTNPRLKDLGAHGTPLGKGLLVTTRRLLHFERTKRAFFGFDEVWFTSQRRLSPKPKDVVITGPHKISPRTIGRLTTWMRGNAISLGLGDGEGMNFCARLQGVGRHLVDALSESEIRSSIKN